MPSALSSHPLVPPPKPAAPLRPRRRPPPAPPPRRPRSQESTRSAACDREGCRLGKKGRSDTQPALPSLGLRAASEDSGAKLHAPPVPIVSEWEPRSPLKIDEPPLDANPRSRKLRGLDRCLRVRFEDVAAGALPRQARSCRSLRRCFRLDRYVGEVAAGAKPSGPDRCVHSRTRGRRPLGAEASEVTRGENGSTEARARRRAWSGRSRAT